MENVDTLEIKGTLHIAASEFVFDLSQLVALNVSDEFGEVAARAQYAHGENQYYIHYKAADGCAKTEWFAEHQLSAVDVDRYPGCRVYMAREISPGAVAMDDDAAKQS